MDRPQRLARKAEEKTAELHGGRITPGSGSGRATKNDVRNEKWSFEVKSTSHKTYPLTREVLKKAEDNAMVDGRHMALVVEFVNPPGMYHARLHAGRYVTMTEDDFLEREQELASIREGLREAEADLARAGAEHHQLIRQWVDRYNALTLDRDQLWAKIEVDC